VGAQACEDQQAAASSSRSEVPCGLHPNLNLEGILSSGVCCDCAHLPEGTYLPC
jgi:hypothetical protein